MTQGLSRAFAVVLADLLPLSAGADTLRGRVVKIVDGDTVDLLIDRSTHRIRLGQVDTPERGQDWGRRASEALSEKIGGKEVRVEVSGTDRYDRLIGTIWLDDRNGISR